MRLMCLRPFRLLQLNVDFKAEILASLMGDVVVTCGERVQLSYCPDSTHHISVNRFKL